MNEPVEDKCVDSSNKEYSHENEETTNILSKIEFNTVFEID